MKTDKKIQFQLLKYCKYYICVDQDMDSKYCVKLPLQKTF